MDGTKVGFLEKTNKIGLRRFLESSDGLALEAEVRLEVLRYLTHKTLEGQFSQ